jgi:hypothetical protein
MYCNYISCANVVIILYTDTELEMILFQEILSALRFTTVLEKQTILEVIKKLSYVPFMEPAVSLTSSLHPDIEPYPGMH